MEVDTIPETSTINTKPIYENLKFWDEIVKCRRIKNVFEEYKEAFDKADFYREKAIISARQATKREIISTSQDGMENYAEPWDRIIQDPGDTDPYVFGSKNDSIEKREEHFNKRHEAIPGQPGKFRVKWIIKAVQVKENIVFNTSWWDTMWTKAGGWVADGWYGIAEDSFKHIYEKFDPKENKDQVIEELRKDL
jgi:hypothetical protein